MLAARLLAFALLLGLLAPPSASAQTGEPPPIMMTWEPPPIIGLGDGKLTDLSPLRSGKYGIQMEIGGDMQPTPVQFQAVAMRNGERMAQQSRTMIIWPSGDQVRSQTFCVDTWDVMPMLYEASNEGRLPEGEYEISLFVSSERGEELGDPVSFRFVVE